jgi:hypothetical protein
VETPLEDLDWMATAGMPIRKLLRTDSIISYGLITPLNIYRGSSGDASAGSVIIEETIKAPMKARDSEDEEPEMKEAMVIKPQDRLKAMGAQALAGAAPIFGTQ